MASNSARSGSFLLWVYGWSAGIGYMMSLHSETWPEAVFFGVMACLEVGLAAIMLYLIHKEPTDDQS